MRGKSVHIWERHDAGCKRSGKAPTTPHAPVGQLSYFMKHSLRLKALSKENTQCEIPFDRTEKYVAPSIQAMPLLMRLVYSQPFDAHMEGNGKRSRFTGNIALDEEP